MALLLTASFVLTACGGAGAGQEEVVTLYHNWGTEPPTADPAMTTDTTSSALIGSTFIGLTDQDDATLEIIPSLATDWSSSEDKLTWTFNLRDDVPWVTYNTSAEEIEQLYQEGT